MNGCRGLALWVGLSIDSQVLGVIQGESARVLYESLEVKETSVGGEDTSSQVLKKGKNLTCAKTETSFVCSFKVLPDGTTEGYH